MIVIDWRLLVVVMTWLFVVQYPDIRSGFAEIIADLTNPTR